MILKFAENFTLILFAGITCFTCRNAASEEECLRSGVTLCQRGEICQSEVRQIATNRVYQQLS